MNLHNKTNILIFAIAATLFTGCKKEKATQIVVKKENKIAIDKSLTSRIDNCLKSQRVVKKTAVYVYDLTADKPIYGYHQDELMPPASCMKLVSGIAALHLFGPDYCFSTQLFVKGNKQDNTLNGDLTLKADLDPLFSPEDMKMFARKLKAKGFNKITGKIYLDLIITDPVKSEQHWYPWDLSFSKYGLFFKGSTRIEKEWKASLRANGIAFADSNVVIGKMPEGSKCIYRYYRPLSLSLSKMWKNSSNIQSTSILYAIGHRVNPNGDPEKNGVQYLKYFVNKYLEHSKSWGTIHDACGLCTYNRLSPTLLVNVLKYGYQNPVIFKWLSTHLPLSGVDGSLRRDMTQGPAYAKIRAKTGTLSHPFGISTLSGYCMGKNGHQLCFSIMNSEMSVLDARVMQRKICEELVQ